MTMKTIILLLLTAQMYAQWVPVKVDRIMQQRADVRKPIDTVSFENRMYIFNVRGDSSLTYWTLKKEQRLYRDYWKGAFIGAFFETWGELLVVSKMETDQALHFTLSEIMAGGATYGFSKVVDNKWAAMGLGAGSVICLGLGKEWLDPYFDGVRSKRDMTKDILGALSGAIKVRIVLK
jgi:uncharacterized protein YfiM (DUF2279 family)